MLRYKENIHLFIATEDFNILRMDSREEIDKAKMTHSMSRVGKYIDNGPMESFWGSLKCEKYYLNKYDSFEELCQGIEEYILFYNHDRPKNA